MTIKQRIKAFSELGLVLEDTIIGLRAKTNTWFTAENLQIASAENAEILKPENLKNWTANYPKLNQLKTPKNIGIITAGNIPLVGFHDFLSVLISGNNFVGKLSSKDDRLLPALAKKLMEIEPNFSSKISFPEGKFTNIDAVIATGSNNSARYFEYYFGKYPNLIRKNRSSVAVLTGNETQADLQKLADDIFIYFGMGCRSVSKIFLPKDYNIQPLFENMMKYKEIVNHHKYANNYDYHRAIFLMNLTKFWDNGFVTLLESKGLGSPVSVLFFEYYENIENIKEKLHQDKDKLQCVVALPNLIENSVEFGQTQHPKLTDYADNADTLQFLLNLKS